jgi:hypothetical protein
MPLRLPIKTARATSALAARQLLTPNLFDTGNAYFDGTSSAAYNIKTGEMWITAIRTPMQTPYWAGASYQTSAIQNTGAVPWKGVTVTATFQVVSVSGGGFAEKILWAAGVVLNGDYAPAILTIQQEGTYTVTSLPADVSPDASFYGIAYMNVVPSMNKSSGVYAKLVSLKVNI